MTGVASVMDIFAQTPHFHKPKSENTVDLEAIGHDWRMVGQDFRKGMSKELTW